MKNIENKLLLVLLSLILVMGILIGCAAPTPAETIKLKFAHAHPLTDAAHTDIFVPWAKRIEERTKAIGKPVEITFFGAAALGPKAEHYDMCVKGVADIVGYWGVHEMPGRFPLCEAVRFPFLIPSATVAAQALWEAYEKWPEIQKELNETKLLYYCPTPPQNIMSTGKQIKTLEDWAGQKFWAQGGLSSQSVKAMGAVPVPMGMTDVYSGLEKGLLDMQATAWNATYSFKLYEVTSWRLISPGGWTFVPLAVSMNLDAWNKLPRDVQAIFTELSGMAMSKNAGQTSDAFCEVQYQKILEYDKKVGNPAPYIVPDSEYQRWVQVLQPVRSDYLAGLEAKGLPGEKFLSDFESLIKKYSGK